MTVHVMTPLRVLSALMLSCVTACGSGGRPSGDASSEQRPNILLIVADDMGYTDLGAWGSEIRTPNLDALALGGVRFANFHTAPICAPTRAMLMSGTTNHQAGVGSMHIKRAYDIGRELGPELLGYGQPGYESHLSARVAALPELMQDAGYQTYMTGKWDLGRALDETHMPAGRGFESSFILTTGSANHLGTPNRDASGIVKRVDPNPYRSNGTVVTELPEDFFSTQVFTDKLIASIDSNLEDGRPFFAWLSYTAPHWPLQVPDDWRDRYDGSYEQGYDVLRQRRVGRATELGILADDFDLAGYRSEATPWNELDENARAYESRTMELYAAMVENMDHHVGRLVQYLRDAGALDRTVILFMSDNGAAAGGPYSFDSADNSLDNMGRWNSWVNPTRGWAEASTAPYRGVKGSLARGGTMAAAFVHHGAVTKPGSIDRGYLTVMDVVPTLLDVAGIDPPQGRFQGRDVVPMRGKSFWSRVEGDDTHVHHPDEPIGWELHGNRALVRGEWKILMPAATGRWELFNLEQDPGETKDLAEQHPELLGELTDAWDRYAAETGVAVP